MKRGKLLWLFLVLLVVLLFPVRANFACGVLNGTGNLSSSWFEVQTYYPSNPLSRTSCGVSPDENKFCCDSDGIQNESWAIGREFIAEVSDKGYVAGPVRLVFSGEGYDLFPSMQLRKVIAIESPNKSIYIGDDILVNISIIEEYNSLDFFINYSGRIVNEEWGYDTTVCRNCTHAEFNLENLPYGSYELIFVASDSNGKSITESARFSLVEFINFFRKMECPRCRKDLIYSGQIVNVTVGFNASSALSGTFRDYYPKDWRLAGDDMASLRPVSETHNEILWEITNQSRFKQGYSLIAPKVLFTKRYIFQSAFDSYFGEKYPVIVYWFYTFWPYPGKYFRDLNSINYFSEYARISPENALVMDLEGDEDLTNIILFPRRELEKVYLFVNKNPPVRKSGARFNFMVGSNIDESDISEFFISFQIKKSGFFRTLLNVGFYQYDVESDSWRKIDVEKIGEDVGYLYYRASVSSFGVFAVEPIY